MRVALVLPWYGRKPWYWPLFEQSAAGVGMDVIVVAEKGFAVSAANFLVVEMSLGELRARASDALGCDVRLENGYKLCDLKPMYGLIFADLLKGYDYWAFGDCDVVYGRKMDDFIKRVTEGGYDVASPMSEWVSGPFTLMRNTKKVNELFMRADGWRDVLAKPGCQGFDEFGNYWFQRYCFEHVPLEDIRKEPGTFGSAVWNAQDIRFLHEDWMCEDGLSKNVVKMDGDRCLTCGGTEFAIFHFIAIKGRPFFVGRVRGREGEFGYELTRDGYFPANAKTPRWLMVILHRCQWALEFIVRLAKGDKGEWFRVRRYVRKKLGVRQWYLEG